MRTIPIFAKHSVMTHTMMAKAIKTLELHYPAIQVFLVNITEGFQELLSLS